MKRFVWVNSNSINGKPMFQGMKVGLEGMGYLSVLWVLGGGISTDFDMWSCGESEKNLKVMVGHFIKVCRRG